MMRFTSLALLLLLFVIPVATFAKQSSSQPGSGTPPGSSGQPQPPQPKPNQPQQNPEGEDKEGHTPVGIYMLAVIGIAGILVIVCMPSRKGVVQGDR
jgi:hypothetical protein